MWRSDVERSRHPIIANVWIRFEELAQLCNLALFTDEQADSEN